MIVGMLKEDIETRGLYKAQTCRTLQRYSSYLSYASYELENRNNQLFIACEYMLSLAKEASVLGVLGRLPVVG